MKITVKELGPGQWVIQTVSSVGATSGRTTYPSKEDAIAEAQRLYPGQKISVE